MFVHITFLADNYMFKNNNRNTRIKCEICSKLTVKTPERHHWIIPVCIIPHNIYLFKVNNRTTIKRCETCSKLTTKTLEQHQ